MEENTSMYSNTLTIRVVTCSCFTVRKCIKKDKMTNTADPDQTATGVVDVGWHCLFIHCHPGPGCSKHR